MNSCTRANSRMYAVLCAIAFLIIILASCVRRDMDEGHAVAVTSQRIKLLFEKIRIYVELHHRFEDTAQDIRSILRLIYAAGILPETENEPKELVTDYWGNDFVVSNKSTKTGTRLIVTSSGRNGQLYDSDDIVVRITINYSERIAEMRFLEPVEK